MAEILHDGWFQMWAAITLICVVPTAAHYWYKVRKAEWETDLKRDMVARGMSADDIERVLAATSRRHAPAADE